MWATGAVLGLVDLHFDFGLFEEIDEWGESCGFVPVLDFSLTLGERPECRATLFRNVQFVG